MRPIPLKSQDQDPAVKLQVVEGTEPEIAKGPQRWANFVVATAVGYLQAVYDGRRPAGLPFSRALLAAIKRPGPLTSIDVHLRPLNDDGIVRPSVTGALRYNTSEGLWTLEQTKSIEGGEQTRIRAGFVGERDEDNKITGPFGLRELYIDRQGLEGPIKQEKHEFTFSDPLEAEQLQRPEIAWALGELGLVRDIVLSMRTSYRPDRVARAQFHMPAKDHDLGSLVILPVPH